MDMQMEQAMEQLQECTALVMDAAKKFSVTDYAVFKSLLFSAGLLTGIRYARSLRKYTFLIGTVFVFCYAWIIYRLLFVHLERPES
ncbi:hypothetical protein [Anaerotalea alkaliphila]|uniref:Uncharacterized protein n=1 Tax=Anaerotalea alkaliphila TaxID=2662126 RepID=A0A7X5KNY7_9FIRM|nr:hypothetical protein [Anaerotalea alkaliphila]NDL68313.1 hypothetical protein [Anaerotalea alkaliphila]